MNRKRCRIISNWIADGTRCLSGLVMLCVAALAIFAGSALFAQSVEEVKKSLREPIRVLRKDGRVFRGNPISFEKDRFQLESTKSGEGEVVYTLKAENIDEFYFPGNEAQLLIKDLLKNDSHKEAMELFDALWRQQANLFSYLPNQRVRFFERYVDLALEQDDPAKAISIAKKMKTHVEEPLLTEKLEDAVLLGYFRLDLKKETNQLMKEWLDKAEAYHSSALGWRIKSWMRYDKKDYENALWVALYPITFSSQVPMPYLGHCYAIAIAAAHQMEKKDKARLLYQEMKERELEWPDDLPDRLLSIKAKYAPADKPQKKTNIKSKNSEQQEQPTSQEAASDKPKNKENASPENDTKENSKQPALPTRTN